MTGNRDDLPEGVINADPAGGWESGDVTDGETADADAREAEEAAAPSATDPASEDHTGSEAGAASGDDAPVPDGFVESAVIQQGLDPDLQTDEQADR